MRFNDLWASILVTSLALLAGCGSSSPMTTPGTGGSGTGGSGSGGSGTGGNATGGNGSGGNPGNDGGSGGAAVDGGPDGVAMMPIPGTCQAPLDPDKPYDKLSQTGCMDPTDVTKMASRVFAYEVN